MDTFYDYTPYPNMYYKIYPKVNQCIEDYFGSVEIGGDISQNEIESMIDKVYEDMINEFGEIQQDSAEIENQEVYIERFRRPFYGRRRLLRDMIGIIFLDQIFRRRRSRPRPTPRRYPDYNYSPYRDDYWY